MTEPAPLLAVTHLSRRFAMRRGFLSRAAPSFLHAVDDVSLSIAPGRSVGLVGESGCGKSTLVRLVARLLDATEGEIAFDGEDLAAVPAARFARHPRRRELQVVFQDPTESLNPRYTAFDSIAEPLRLLEGVRDSAGLEARVKAAARDGAVPAQLPGRFPPHLPGGQTARLIIPRPLAGLPTLASPPDAPAPLLLSGCAAAAAGGGGGRRPEFRPGLDPAPAASGAG